MSSSGGRRSSPVSGDALPSRNCRMPALCLAPCRVAVLVDVAGVDPDDVRLGAVLGALGAVEVELVLERGVGQQRRYDHGPAVLRGELVGPVARATEEHAELAFRPRPDVGVVDRVVRAVVGEALVLQRLEQDLERLLVAVARLEDRHAGLGRDPAVAAQRAELVAALEEDARHGDLRCQDRRVVVREDVAERPELDVLRARGALAPERERVRGDRELGEEEVLDDRRTRRSRAGRRARPARSPRHTRASGTCRPSTGSPSRSKTSSASSLSVSRL